MESAATFTCDKQFAANAAAVVKDVKNVAFPAVRIVYLILSSRFLACLACRNVLMKTNTSSTPMPSITKSETASRIPRVLILKTTKKAARARRTDDTILRIPHTMRKNENDVKARRRIPTMVKVHCTSLTSFCKAALTS